MLTNVQREILEFAKNEYFHVSLNDFISRTGTSMSEAVDALKNIYGQEVRYGNKDLEELEEINEKI